MLTLLLIVVLLAVIAAGSVVFFKGVGIVVSRAEEFSERHSRRERKVVAPSDASGPEAVEQVEVNKAGVGLALGGAALMIIATFLPRLESIKFSWVVDNSLIASGDGFFINGLAVAVVVGTFRIHQQGRHGWEVFVGGLAGIAAAVYSGTGDRLDLEGVGPLGSSLTESASPGIGVYAAGIGALMVAAGGLLLAGRTGWVGAAAGRPMKRCPDCAETVLADARVCRYCGHEFAKDAAPWEIT